MLKLYASRCVHSLSSDSQCNKCEQICPTEAIVVASKPLPSIDFLACVTCGACDAICPTEALSLDEFSLTDFFFKYISDKDNLISCRKNVPCIAALNIEDIISIAIVKKEIILDMGYCDSCDIAYKCKLQIEKNHEEASYILEAMQSDAVIKLENIKYEVDKRDFFNSITLNAVSKKKNDFENEIKKATKKLLEHTLEKKDSRFLKQKRITNRKKLFFTAIKRLEEPSPFHVIEANEISFTSQKLINQDTCTACQLCYRLCPSGALASDIRNSKIDFDPFLCVKCNLCHDVCESDSITLSSSYKIKSFFKPAIENLINFSLVVCSECSILFSTNFDEKLCQRCKEISMEVN